MGLLFASFFLLTCGLRHKVAFPESHVPQCLRPRAGGWVQRGRGRGAGGRRQHELLGRVRKEFLRVTVKTHNPVKVVTCLGVRQKDGMQRPLPPPSSASGSGGPRSVLAGGATEPVAESVGPACVEPASSVKRARTAGLSSFSLLAKSFSPLCFGNKKPTTGSPRHLVCAPPATGNEAALGSQVFPTSGTRPA